MSRAQHDEHLAPAYSIGTHWPTLVGTVGAVALGLVLNSYVFALVYGAVLRRDTAWISRTSGEERRAAILISQFMWVLLGVSLWTIYNPRAFLVLVGLR